MRIPLVDLGLQHDEVAAEVAAGFAAVIDRKAFILSDDVTRFEGEFAAFSEARHCVGVANGTDALELMLRAVGVGPGDEVIAPANTFIATVLGVIRAGARPILVDCDPVHHLIDVGQVEARIGARTKAILPVHLYGQIAAIEDLDHICRARGLLLLADGAQSQGATRHGRGMGKHGLATATSFYPGKNLGAYGDAGAVITSDDEIAARLRGLRNYGSEVKYHHPEIGFNSRLDPLQAVVLSAKLKRLAGWNQQRRAAAERYDQLLNGMVHVVRPATLAGNEHVWHLYVIRVPERDQVLKRLHEVGIGAGIHYPIPIHLQGAMRDFGYRAGDFPVTEAVASEILSLPLYPGITAEQQQEVAHALGKALG
jgi:dTDP-4-amino-4,6-dideoxygalactose transaminase